MLGTEKEQFHDPFCIQGAVAVSGTIMDMCHFKRPTVVSFRPLKTVEIPDTVLRNVARLMPSCNSP